MRIHKRLSAFSFLKNAPGWCRDPYRLFFPLGVLLAWGGVFHWFLHGIGYLPEYRPVFHSIIQIQGFMICFAVGFLFTAIPRRTGTAPPAPWQVILGLLSTVGTAVCAWYQLWWLSQVFWVVLVVVVIGFLVRRFLSPGANRRPPNSFLWVPLSFGIGLAGSLLIGAYGFLGQEYLLWHEMGKLLLLQGMFLGLVVGVGGMVIPLISRGEASTDASGYRGDQLRRLGHLAAAALLVASFWVENFISLRGGLVLRAVVLLSVLLASARIWRLPCVPGWHRKLVWISAWMIPLGYTLAALFPEQKKAGLHVVFIGGFALMAFSVGLHVILAHGGYQRLVRGRPWQVPLFGGLFLLAMVFRVLVDFDLGRFSLWVGASAACFLLATFFWVSLILPRLWGQEVEREAPPVSRVS